MAETPTCPRCGYDQQGVIDSWKTECPLAGICSECGLEFEWRDLLDHRFRIKPWFFEHALRRFVRSFFYTLWRSLRPWSFWQWVRLEDKADAKRIGTMVILGSACLSLSGAALLSAAAMLAVWLVAWSQGWWLDYNELEMAAMWPVVDPYYEVLHELWLLPLVAVLFSWALGPSLLVLFGPSFRIAKVRRIHLLRVWAYSSLHLPLVYSFFSVASITNRLLFEFYGVGGYRSPWTIREKFTDWFMDWGGCVAGAFSVLWFALYIRFAVSRYLRLPSSQGVAISIGLITGLSAALLAVGLWFVLATFRPYLSWG